jgi:hypothetical protein
VASEPPVTGVTGPQVREDLGVLAAYLARRDLASLSPGDAPHVDVLVLCGSAVLSAVDVAASAFRAGLADRLLVTGGVGHSTAHLERAVREHPLYRGTPTAGRPESAVIADILRAHHGVPRSALLVEDRSTNCGENAELSVDLLARTRTRLRSLVLVQDPTMQRRTHECFRRSLRGAADVAVWSHAPFVPVVPEAPAQDVVDGAGRPAWSMRRFTSLVLGEVRRLRDDEEGYGPRGAGFIDHVDVPPDVVDAHRRLVAAQAGSVRQAWRP